MAALRFSARVAIRQAVTTPQGVWVVSSLPPSTTGDSSGAVGSTSGPYGQTHVGAAEYGEVLLLDSQRQRILRAFPLPGLPPQRILLAHGDVYCERQGDGALPDSMLCGIDRVTYEWHARIFPNATESAFLPLPTDRYLPPNWQVDLPTGKAMFTSISWHRGRLRIAGDGYSAAVDPKTLRIE